ncbi:apoptosis-inducing factor [Penicillium chermesinum]|nr:apoptosis-inducing factor [Penicillium chermesinum]
MTNIVILGGSITGISTAHRILKGAPKAGLSVKVTLVTPNTHFFWNIASPRGIIAGQYTDDKCFLPIETGFKQYNASQFEFVLGLAEAVDFDAHSVRISNGRTIKYDHLVLATGASATANLPFKNLGTTEATKDALHILQGRVQKAKTVVIGGSGATGVEVAGEIAFEYKNQKKVTLISSGPIILEQTIPKVSQTAAKILKSLDVNIKYNSKVTSTTETADGGQELTLSNGEKFTADLYIPTFGLIPNTSYLNDRYLNSKGFVIVNDYLKVKGVDDVWAIGDVSDHERPQFMFADSQSAHLVKNLLLEETALHKVASPAMGLQIGRKKGTGHMGNFKLPGFLVSLLRKDLFLEIMPGIVDGSKF